MDIKRIDVGQSLYELWHSQLLCGETCPFVRSETSSRRVFIEETVNDLACTYAYYAIYTKQPKPVKQKQRRMILGGLVGCKHQTFTPEIELRLCPNGLWIMGRSDDAG